MNRTDLLSALIQRFGLLWYLELGTQDKKQNFNKINRVYKCCVDIDPSAEADFTMSTDQYFEQYGNEGSIFDIIFIDASHEYDQVRKDFINSIPQCTKFIVLHDCNPLKEEHTIVPRPTKTGHWNGDVYKLACNIPNECKYTVDIDNGCCVVNVPILKKYIADKLFDLEEGLKPTVDWQTFDQNRRELLNLITWDDFNTPY
jgi:hypothetical protein